VRGREEEMAISLKAGVPLVGITSFLSEIGEMGF